MAPPKLPEVEQKENTQSVIAAEREGEERETAPPFEVEVQPENVWLERVTKPAAVDEKREQTEAWKPKRKKAKRRAISRVRGPAIV
jgi:hypothetical protein